MLPLLILMSNIEVYVHVRKYKRRIQKKTMVIFQFSNALFQSAHSYASTPYARIKQSNLSQFSRLNMCF